MAGHRNGRPRRDVARAERSRARIAAASDELQAMVDAFDWLRAELQHLGRCGAGKARTAPRAGEPAVIAREVTRDLAARAEHVIKMSEEVR